MKKQFLTLVPLLAFTELAQAHTSHTHMAVHNIEHLLLFGALLLPALFIARPAIRRFLNSRK